MQNITNEDVNIIEDRTHDSNVHVHDVNVDANENANVNININANENENENENEENKDENENENENVNVGMNMKINIGDIERKGKLNNNNLSPYYPSINKALSISEGSIVDAQHIVDQFMLEDDNTFSEDMEGEDIDQSHTNKVNLLDVQLTPKVNTVMNHGHSVTDYEVETPMAMGREWRWKWKWN